MRHANETVSDEEFFRERQVSPGVSLPNKEEMLYFRIFREMFPVDRVLTLLGNPPM